MSDLTRRRLMIGGAFALAGVVLRASRRAEAQGARDVIPLTGVRR
jgi:hypothetical protein